VWIEVTSGMDRHGGIGMPELRTGKRDKLPREAFAFPKERKEPLNDAAHVRNAVARFDQVEGVTNAERDAAWRRIRTAARRFGVEIEERGWRQLFKRSGHRVPEG
jgi:hypothetical protein